VTLAPRSPRLESPRVFCGAFFGQAQREIGQSFWIAVTEADYSDSRPRTFVTRGCSRDGWRGRLGSRSARSARLSHASAMLSSRVLLLIPAALPAMSTASAANCRYSSCLLMMRLELHYFRKSHPGAYHTAARESYFRKLTMLPQRNKKSRLLRGSTSNGHPRRLRLRQVSPSFPTVVAGLVERWPTARTCASRSASAAWMIISSRDFPISPGRAATA
jgi:hypothetical protein